MMTLIMIIRKNMKNSPIRMNDKMPAEAGFFFCRETDASWTERWRMSAAPIAGL